LGEWLSPAAQAAPCGAREHSRAAPPAIIRAGKQISGDQQHQMSALPNIIFLGNSSKEALLDSLRWQDIHAHLHKSTDPGEALVLVERFTPSLILLDLDNDRIDVLDFLNHLSASGAAFPPQVIGLTEKNPLQLIIESVKMGVSDVINIKQEADKLCVRLGNLQRREQSRQLGNAFHRQQMAQFDFSAITGESPGMQRVFGMLSKIIRRKWVTVLITGETGTGKELIARTIHFNNFEQYQPFVEINCNALPENLLESELFGYEKGAFRTRNSAKKGFLSWRITARCFWMKSATLAR